MKKKILVFLLSLITSLCALPLALTGCSDGDTSEPPADETVKVLFIGNSFTFYSDVPALFKSVANGAGEKVVVESVTKSSWTLEKFADKTDECGRIVDEKLISRNDYDVVVLQEQTTRPLNDYPAFLNSAYALKKKIDETQKNCRTYLYSTWGYEEAASARGMTVPQMEEKVRQAYDRVAKVLNVPVCYVGKAFSTVYTQYPQYNLYHTDNKHQSYTGAYLSACVHVATILNCNPKNSDFAGELNAATATALKSIAYETVFGA